MKSEANAETRARIDEAHRLMARGDLAEALSLFLKLFDEGYEFVAPSIGWIYDQPPRRDTNNALKFYKIGAELGDAYAQHGLGGLYYLSGNIPNAIIQYKGAIENGNRECLYLLYKLLNESGKNAEARTYLQRAAHAKDPFAIRDLSFEYLKGNHGYINVIKGVYLYLGNVRRLLKARLERARYNR